MAEFQNLLAHRRSEPWKFNGLAVNQGTADIGIARIPGIFQAGAQVIAAGGQRLWERRNADGGIGQRAQKEEAEWKASAPVRPRNQELVAE